LLNEADCRPNQVPWIGCNDVKDEKIDFTNLSKGFAGPSFTAKKWEKGSDLPKGFSDKSHLPSTCSD